MGRKYNLTNLSGVDVTLPSGLVIPAKATIPFEKDQTTDRDIPAIKNHNDLKLEAIKPAIPSPKNPTMFIRDRVRLPSGRIVTITRPKSEDSKTVGKPRKVGKKPGKKVRKKATKSSSK